MMQHHESMMPIRAYTRSRFGQLHYMTAGDRASDRPPLLLLHQNPSSINEYIALAREMARDRFVIAFDTPGSGMSDRPPQAQSIAGYAAAFADGLDALALDLPAKFDVFGFHTGTYLSTELALIRPDLIGRVILSGIPFRPADQRASRLAAAEAGKPIEEDGASLFGWMRDIWAMTVEQRDPKTPIERAVELFAERVKPMHRAAWPYVGVWSYPAEERLPRLTQPVLILQPHEPLLEYSRQAAAMIPHVTFLEYPELCHDVFEQGIAQFAAAMRGWDAVAA